METQKAFQDIFNLIFDLDQSNRELLLENYDLVL